MSAEVFAVPDYLPQVSRERMRSADGQRITPYLHRTHAGAATAGLTFRF